jgi:hypothetical protein
MKVCGQRQEVDLLLFPRIPQLFFRSLGAGFVDDGTRAGGRRRKNCKELQVAVANVSQIVESSRSDQDRVVLVGDFFSIAKGHFSFAFDNEQDHIRIVVYPLAKLSRP